MGPGRVEAGLVRFVMEKFESEHCSLLIFYDIASGNDRKMVSYGRKT